MSRVWRNEKELAELLIARANRKRKVTLTPETALFVGLKLMTASEKPTRDEVAKLLCNSKCLQLCYNCQGTANMIVRVYGHRVDPGYDEAEGGVTHPSPP